MKKKKPAISSPQPVPLEPFPDHVFSPPLESQLQAWHINFFSADLLVSFLPECVNHKLIYEGNFYWCHLYLSDCTHFTFLACYPFHLSKISLFSFKGTATKVKASLTASRLWWPEAPVCGIRNWPGSIFKAGIFLCCSGDQQGRNNGLKRLKWHFSLPSPQPQPKLKNIKAPSFLEDSEDTESLSP